MANFCVLNRLLKLHKLLTSINATTTATTAVTLCNGYSQQQQQIRRSYKAQLFYQQRHFSSNREVKIDNTDAVKNEEIANSTLEEFRAREEKREQDYERLHQSQNESKQNTNEDDAKKQDKVNAVRQKILDAALLHVPTMGWSRNAIVRGAEDAGMPSVVHGMFPEGGFALVSYFNGKCNDRLVKQLQLLSSNDAKAVKDPVDFLVNAVRMRLEMIVPYKSQWPQAMALIALPQNTSTALAQVLTLVDDICYYSGDHSVDLGWYTRRIGLATIMKITELYMLQDTSPGHSSTWDFLKNRMNEAVQLQVLLSQTDGVTHHFQRSFKSAFITARNILGLGYDRR